MLAILKNKDVLKLILAQALSRFGDSIHTVALLLLVFELTGSSLSVGILTATIAAASLMVLPISGVLSDRVNKRLVMAFLDFFRFIFILLIPALLYLDGLIISYIYLFSFIIAVGENIYAPAALASLPSLVKKSDITAANGLAHSTIQLASLIGFAVGGMIVAKIGFIPGFIANAGTFLLSGILVALIRAPLSSATESGEKAPGFLSELKKGMKYVFTRFHLIVVLFVCFLIGAIIGPIEVIVPKLNKALIGSGRDGSDAGILLGALSVGLILGSLCTGKISKVLSQTQTVFIGSSLIACAFTLGYLLPLGISSIVAMFFVIGMGVAILRTIVVSQGLQRADCAYRGRFSSWILLVVTLSAPAFGAAAGLLLDFVPLRSFMQIAMLVTMGLVPLIMLLAIRSERISR